MALILHLETATKVCSVALSRNGQLLASKEVREEKYSHAEQLNLFVEDVMEQAGCSYTELDAVAVSKGPGSYTGLRIGVASAKGLCYGLKKPLIAVETLDALAAGMRARQKADHYIPMIDARRMEVYCAVYDAKGEQVQAVDALIVEGNSFDAFLNAGTVLLGGDGAGKCKAVIEHPNALFLDDQHTSASHMVELAAAKFAAGAFEDVAYFEPYYLKEFIAGKPKKLA